MSERHRSTPVAKIPCPVMGSSPMAGYTRVSCGRPHLANSAPIAYVGCRLWSLNAWAKTAAPSPTPQRPAARNAGASGQLIDGPAKLTPAHNGAGTLNASTVSTPPNDEPATANPPGVYPGPRRDPLHRGQHVAEARGRPMTDRPKGRKICLVDCVLLLEVATDLVRGSLTV